MNTALNRTGVALLTNKSGGSVAKGDTVIVDSANASAFTTTATAGFVNGQIGVVLETIANNGKGMVAFGVWIPQINLNTAATIGQFIKHHSVAKQGTPHSAPMQAGDFAIALEASATPKALLFGSVFQGGNIDTNLGWQLIASSVLAVDGTFSFSSIPSTYQALRLRVRARSDVAASSDQLRLRVGNGAVDTGSNYAYVIRREGLSQANAQSAGATGFVEIIIPGNTETANYFGVVEFTIEDYAVSTYWRNVLIYGGHAGPTTYRINTGIGTWKNAANAIDILGLTPVSGTNFKAGSAAWLFGMKTS